MADDRSLKRKKEGKIFILIASIVVGTVLVVLVGNSWSHREDLEDSREQHLTPETQDDAPLRP